jgi:hypothetical protein
MLYYVPVWINAFPVAPDAKPVKEAFFKPGIA